MREPRWWAGGISVWGEKIEKTDHCHRGFSMFVYPRGIPAPVSLGMGLVGLGNLVLCSQLVL